MLKALIEFGVIGVEGTLENIDFACELVQGSPDQRDLHVCVCVCVCVNRERAGGREWREGERETGSSAPLVSTKKLKRFGVPSGPHFGRTCT